MDALATLLIGAIVSAITQIGKKFLADVNSLIWVGLFAVIGGIGYSFVVPMLPLDVLEKVGFGFATAVGLYEILRSFIKKD